ncbi:DUF2628 domain-containing protein [Vibrio nigripulchritudo]|uniref:DUF2628 domain-containing protein n=1 Tax=Vibrio nigripulchritudo TaxID=28173 RepID=UPI0005F9F22B|nr:DUF2628 domain-containing protein [Vibrio nigripulchritudo]KJY76470.1 hypothetical protein TW74_15565 [Vibrio nigripulchritudo]
MIPTQVEASTRDKVIIPKKESTEAYKAFSWSDYYPDKWKTQIESRKGFAGFNFWAFLFGYRWCMFRRMNRLGLIIFIIENVIMLSAIIAANEFRVDEKIIWIFGLGAHLVLMIMVGLFGNYAYFKFAQTHIKRISTSMISEDSFGEAVRNAGGVSLLAVFVLMGINIFIYAVIGTI